MARILPYPRFRALKSDGTPAAGYKLYSYSAGTSNPLATYTEQDGATAHANPLVLNGVGEPPVGSGVWLAPTSAYKLVLKDESDVEQWTIDNIQTTDAAAFATLTVSGAATFATISASGQITSTVSTGTAPLVIASSTLVANLNAALLNGGSWGSIPGDGAGLVDLIPVADAGNGQKVRIQSRRGSSGANIPGRDIHLLAASGTDAGKGGDIILEPGTSPTGTDGAEIYQAPNGGQWIRGHFEEQITLNTGGAATDSAGNLLPANSIIEAVVWRVTTTITTAATYSIGDATQAARFVSANAGLAAGSTGVGLLHHNPANASNDLGPVQTSAAKLRITCNAAPGAGVIRAIVFYRQFVPPTS